MRKCTIALTAVLVAVVLAQSASVQADSAQQAFSDGKALLTKADFNGALQAFARAARADNTNQEYFQHYAMVRQVITLRQRLKTEQDPARWEYLASGLHAFFVSQGIYSEALVLDRQVHARLKTAASAAMLAETQLALNLDAEAAAVLSELNETEATPSTLALLGIALARQGKIEDARQVAEGIQLPDTGKPGMVYNVARLQAASGNADEAISLLQRCFESVPPSRLDGFKAHAKACPDFSELASTTAFAKVLETKSKVPESKCSGGSGCGNCPMRGKCPKSQGQ